MTYELSTRVNGAEITGVVEGRTSLGDFLRGDCALTGTHFGCEHGVCGACTVLLDGVPVRSCLVFAVQADACAVETVEGFVDDEIMRSLRSAFSRHHALQCGFCTSGMLISAWDIVTRLGAVDEQRIREELAGNLCRCTGYVGIVRAIQDVAGQFLEGGRVKQYERPSPAPRGPEPSAAAPAMPRSTAGQAAPPVRERSIETEKPRVVSGGDGFTITQAFDIPHPLERVWAFLADPRTVADCLPGAEIISVEGEDLRGRVQIKMGPIKAHFAGDARYTRDVDAKVGTVVGAGKDSLSNSRVNGRLEYALSAPDADTTHVAVTINFTLQGVLAHFSRPAIVKDFTSFLMAQFSEQLSRRLAGDTTPQPAGEPRLDMFKLVWWWIRSRFK